MAAPIAHGYLTLSLAATLAIEAGVIPNDAGAALNYGLDKARFIAPVTCRRANPQPRDADRRRTSKAERTRVAHRYRNTIEIEGEAKPALDRRRARHADGHAGGMTASKANDDGNHNRFAPHRKPQRRSGFGARRARRDAIAEHAAQHTLARKSADRRCAAARFARAAATLARRTSPGEPRMPSGNTQFIAELAGELARILAGRSVLAPAASDRRFADAAWSGNAGYQRLLQTYAGARRRARP